MKKIILAATAAAALIARNAVSGYRTSRTPASCNSLSVKCGVLPNSVRFASTGTGTAVVNWRYSSRVVNASAKIMSAPAAT